MMVFAPALQFDHRRRRCLWKSSTVIAAAFKKLDEEVKERMLPFDEDLELLDTIPGVGRRTAEQILAEIGTDMNQFPSAAHLCSWDDQKNLVDFLTVRTILKASGEEFIWESDSLA